MNDPASLWILTPLCCLIMSYVTLRLPLRLFFRWMQHVVLMYVSPQGRDRERGKQRFVTRTRAAISLHFSFRIWQFYTMWLDQEQQKRLTIILTVNIGLWCIELIYIFCLWPCHENSRRPPFWCYKIPGWLIFMLSLSFALFLYHTHTCRHTHAQTRTHEAVDGFSKWVLPRL